MAQQTVIYKVVDLVGEIVLAPAKTALIYNLIAPHIRAGRHVTLDFEGVRIVPLSFWHWTLDALMEDLEPQHVLQSLEIVYAPDYLVAALPSVLQTSYQWYHDTDYRARVQARQAEYAKENDEDYAGLS